MKFQNELIAHDEYSIFLHVNVDKKNNEFQKIHVIFIKFAFAEFAIQFILNQFF